MTLNEAQDAFAVRFYRWSLGDFAREIIQDFPLLRAIPSGWVWRFLDWIGSLPREQQDQLTVALVKRFHARAVELTGEKVTPEEETWIRQYFETMRAMTLN